MMQVFFLQLRDRDGVTSRLASEFRTRETAARAAACIKERRNLASVSIGYGDSRWRTA